MRHYYLMCISATVSYSASAVLASTGLFAVYKAGVLRPTYWLWALVPVLFGVQQAFEGLVWQEFDAAGADAVNAGSAIPFALGFQFFSHFLWLWWLPLCSYLVEPGKIRKWVFGGCALAGAFAGALVYSAMLLHPDWVSVGVREHSITYSFSSPYREFFHIPLPPSTIYGLIVLVPLLLSSFRLVRIFGELLAISVVVASEAYSYAFVSVWCFFAAVLSLYLVFMIPHLAAEQEIGDETEMKDPSGPD